jgi:hypothetical protein
MLSVSVAPNPFEALQHASIATSLAANHVANFVLPLE